MKRLIFIALLSACAPVATTTRTAAPSSALPPGESAAPSATAAPTISAPGVPFPDLPLVAASSTGELYVLRSGQWAREAQVCPSGVATYSGSILDLHLSADGRHAWFRCDVAGPPGQPIRAYVYDFETKAAREVIGASEVGLGPISPDGRFVVLAAPGECPMPAPVCQSTRTLVDLETQSRRVILPSDYWLALEMRWTSFGLTYFRPECAPAGCTSPDKAGTYRWDGSRWSKIAPYRFIQAAVEDHVLFESRRSLEVGEPAVVIERDGATERVLTGSGREYGLALEGRRATTFRPSDGTAGTYVHYEDGRETSRVPGNFSPYMYTRSGDWIVSLDRTPSGATLWAYSTARQTVASRMPGLSIVGLASPVPTPFDTCAADPAVLPQAASEFVIHRYFQLSNGGSVAAISDCFARVYREANRNFTENAQRWSSSGPAFGVAITRLDRVNECERFSASATLRGSADRVTWFFIVGPESGRARIYAVQSALATPELETTRCG